MEVKNSHTELARRSLELFPAQGHEGEAFNVEKLLVERAYLSSELHAVHGRLSLVRVHRPKSAEDMPDFADGNETSASATVKATTYWLVGDARLRLSCIGEYSYSTAGHSGGVEEVEGEPDEPVAFPEDVPCSEEEWAMLRNVARLAAFSCHETASQYLEDCSPSIPRAFLALLRDSAGLWKLDEFIGNTKVVKSWAEWQKEHLSNVKRQIEDGWRRHPALCSAIACASSLDEVEGV